MKAARFAAGLLGFLAAEAMVALALFSLGLLP